MEQLDIVFKTICVCMFGVFLCVLNAWAEKEQTENTYDLQSCLMVNLGDKDIDVYEYRTCSYI